MSNNPNDRLAQLQLQMLLEEMATRGASDFLKKHNLPPELMDGWKRYNQKVAARAEVGLPMPPGGTFLMGHESVFAGAMAEFHTALAGLLRVPIDKIRLRAQKQPDGMMNVMADVELDGVPDINLVGVDPDVVEKQKDQLFKVYLEQSVALLNKVFHQNLKLRMAACDVIRKDVAQEIVSGQEQTPN